MFPLLGGLISGGASLLGNLFSSNTSAQNTQAQIQGQEALQSGSEQFNAAEAEKTRDFNAQQADINRQYQTQMSNTAFQRSRADAVAAGLNPMVLAGMGGASTPSGSTASGPSASIGTPSMPTPQRTSPLAGLGDAVSKAMSTAIQVKTIDKIAEEISNISADTKLSNATSALRQQELPTQVAETTRRGAEAKSAEEDVAVHKLARQRAEALSSHPTMIDIGEPTKYVSGVAGSVADLAASLVSTARRGISSFSDRFYYGNR